MTLTITDIISSIQTNRDRFGITLYDKATDEDISKFEKIKFALPEDIKTFYKFCNGFYSEEDMFRIIPLDEIISNERDNYVEGENAFHIAEYMIYCYKWTLRVNPKNKNDYTIYNKADDIATLTNSFTEFLDKFLNGDVFEGLYNWREQIKNQTK